MRVIEQIVEKPEEEAVTLEYVKLTRVFRDIRDYCKNRCETILVYEEETAHRIAEYVNYHLDR